MTSGILLLGSADPRRLGPYRLRGVLGHGGMGPVYLGRSTARRGGRGRTAAVRALRPELLRDRQVRARLRYGLGVLRARVTSPYVAQPLDGELDGERPWLAKEFVPGLSLATLLARYGPAPEPVVRVLGAALAHALADLRAAGVAHRALRPTAVLVAADRPRVVDCTLALDHSDESGERPADDVFDLGVLLALTAGGPHPFADGSPPGREAPDLAGVPAALRPALLACLHREPACRPLPGVLAAALDPRGTAARHPSARWLPEPWLRAIGLQAAAARELGGRRFPGWPFGR